MNYTVKAGDTLSGIAAQYGIPYNQITGYKSGNPSLIYPGEVLNVPTAGGSTSLPSQNPNVATSSGGSTGNYQEGGWYDNPATGQNQRWMNGAFLPVGQTGGNAQQTTASSTAGSTGFTMPVKPTIDLQSVYNSAYNTPEITTAQVDVDKADADLLAAQKAYDEAVAINGDNPFYSEATRIGKENQIKEKYNNDVTRLQNARNIAAGKVAQLKSDAEIKINLAMQQYNIDNASYQQTLTQFNALLGAGALINASPEDIASYATATGMPYAMIAGVVQKQKNEEIKPQVITSTDNDGNVTIATIDTATGNIINKTSLGTVGAAKTSSSSAIGNKNTNALKEDVANWYTLQELINKYVGILPQATIMSVYNAFHSQTGDTWGPAKETPQQLSSMFGGTAGVGLTKLSATDQGNVKKLKDGIQQGLFTRDQAVGQFPEYAQYL